MPKLSVCILTKNDADNVAGAVESVRWADEIVVVDNDSTDRTAESARGLGVTVVPVSIVSFGELRARAADACTHDWVLSLDADERCTPAVRDEITALLATDPPHDGYQVPRRNYMMGRWIKGSGWYPNYRGLQLFRRSAVRYTSDPIHEGYELLGDRGVGTLKQDILHFPYRDFDELMQKLRIFSTIGAQKLAGEQVSMWAALGHGVWGFLKHYIFRAGFRDGWAGFVIALGTFEERFYRYAKRHEQIKGWAAAPDHQPVPRDKI